MALLVLACCCRPSSNQLWQWVQVLQFLHRCAAQLGDAGESAEMALQLFLTAAYSASEHAKSELIAYEFFEQVCVGAVEVYEDVKSMSVMSMSAEPAPVIVEQHVHSMHLSLPVFMCRLSCCLRSPFQTALLSAQPCPA